MPRNALVILGAGASAGLAVAGQNLPDAQYTPPLTNEIFNRYAATNHILPKYPRAEQLANSLRTSLITNEDSLEAEMRKFRDEPLTSGSFLEMPLFFQELFGEISAKYSTSNGCYDRLVLELLRSDLEKIAFVTLNYDLFLDRALDTAAGTRTGVFPDISSYVTDNRWMLIKLHGSVSWMRPILSPGDGPGRERDAKRSLLLSLLDKNPVFSVSGAANLRVTDWDDWFSQNPQGAQPHYPHLAVPVEDKSDPLCPQQHLDKLHEFLPTCRNVLTIGVSGRDDDLFKNMASLPESANFFVVGQPLEEAEKALNNFTRRVPQLHNAQLASTTFGGGFGDFLTDGGLDKFIAAARD
ncbi:MAG: SIR2 family protein [Chloroflexi bacterium]|nr:SIR2 family protein [Chloroflexota bacterium]